MKNKKNMNNENGSGGAGVLFAIIAIIIIGIIIFYGGVLITAWIWLIRGIDNEKSNGFR